jgi:hypothetical protein
LKIEVLILGGDVAHYGLAQVRLSVIGYHDTSFYDGAGLMYFGW